MPNSSFEISKELDEELDMGAETNRSKYYPWFGVIAFIPLAINLVFHMMRVETTTIARELSAIEAIKTDQQVSDGLIFKLDGFNLFDESKLLTLAKTMPADCNGLTRSSWYAISEDFKPAQQSLRDYCTAIESRSARINSFAAQTESLISFRQEIAREVPAFDGDAREIQIELLERKLSRYLLNPSPGEGDVLLKITGNFQGARYEHFKTVIAQTVALAQIRSELMREVTNPEIYNVVNEAIGLHVKAVWDQDGSNRFARDYFLFISLVLAIATTFFFWKLAKSNSRLEDFNRSLEAKVKERTSELSQAVDQLHEQQAALAQSAKMSALGEMAGGIAHEINTPLAAISLHAEILGSKVEDNPELAEGLATIITITEKISKIVRGLKRFARMDADVVHADVKITEVLEDTLLLCGEKLRFNGVRLEIERRDRDAMISCSREQLTQVLINLLNNAVNAVETLPEKWVRIETDENDGVFSLRVIDGGAPIPPSVREKMMQPFFTTKGIGKGNGLGLSISKKIMHSHDGTLEFDGEAARTTFVVTLPAVTPDDSGGEPVSASTHKEPSQQQRSA